MKQQISLASLLMLTLTSMAQTTNRLTPYVRAGVGASRAISKGHTAENVIYLLDNAAPNKGGVAAELGGSQWILAGNLGLGLTIPVGEHFSIQAEVNLEQKGSAMTSTRTGLVSVEPCISYTCPTYSVSGRFLTRLTYLTVPLLASYRLGKVAVSAGPYVSRKLSEQQSGRFSVTNSPDTYPIQANTSGGYKNMDVGVVLGVTYALSPLVAVDLRYNHGVRTVTDNYYEGYIDAAYISMLRNQSAQVSLCYNLRR